MTPRDRLYRAWECGATGATDDWWQEIVGKAHAAIKAEQDKLIAVFSSSEPVTTFKPERILVDLHPGQMIVSAMDVMRIEQRLAFAESNLDEIYKLAEEDINQARRARMTSTIETVRRHLKKRGEA